MAETIAIVTPAYNERATLDRLHKRLVDTLDRLGVSWHWTIVDDHSDDETMVAVRTLAGQDARVRGIRLSRNCGSHAAIACGLRYTEADAAIVLASDLEDPPEIIEALVAGWRAGHHVVWAARRPRPMGLHPRAAFGAFYWRLVRRLAGLHEVPPTGSDYFILDRRVIEALRQCRERHTSILALIAWLGFRQSHIEYEKQVRVAGRSGWTWRKKVRLVADSLTAFSAAPLQVAGWLGATLVVAAAGIGVGAVAGGWDAAPAWTVPLLLLTGGLQLLGLAVVGAYLWRTHDEARGRPWYVVEDTVNADLQQPIASKQR